MPARDHASVAIRVMLVGARTWIPVPAALGSVQKPKMSKWSVMQRARVGRWFLFESHFVRMLANSKHFVSTYTVMERQTSHAET